MCGAKALRGLVVTASPWCEHNTCSIISTISFHTNSSFQVKMKIDTSSLTVERPELWGVSHMTWKCMQSLPLYQTALKTIQIFLWPWRARQKSVATDSVTNELGTSKERHGFVSKGGDVPVFTAHFRPRPGKGVNRSRTFAADPSQEENWRVKG